MGLDIRVETRSGDTPSDRGLVARVNGPVRVPGCTFFLGRDESGHAVLYQVNRSATLLTPGEGLPSIVASRAVRVAQDDLVVSSGNRQCNLIDRLEKQGLL